MTLGSELRRRLGAGFVVLGLLGSGCNTAPPKPPLMANSVKAEMTVYQLRSIDYEYASRFSQLVSMCATEIAASASDPEVREAALQWRMWASPQARAAAFDQDPFAGLVELWVLAIQQAQFFAEGWGATWFGDGQTCAPSTAEQLEHEAEGIAAKVVPEADWENLRETVHRWAKNHPIEHALSVRPTARAEIASLFPARSQGGLKAVGSIEETLRDINDRITILTVQMPFEARWQAEYLVASLFDDHMRKHADSVVGAMNGVTSYLAEFDRTLRTQMTALLGGVERERAALVDAVAEERQSILGAIETERVSILDDLDTKLQSATDELDAVGKGLIDHFFKRLIQVLIGMGIFVIVVVALVLFVARRSRNDEH